MKNVSQQKWLSLSININYKTDVDFIYQNLYNDIIGTFSQNEKIIFYFDDSKQQLVEGLIANNKNFTLNKMGYENWHSNYKDYFQPITVDDKVMIIPDWFNTKDLSIDWIKILPGMAFGTGNHETTQLVISNIIKYINSGSKVLDLGTGSGILAIAALKYGSNYVTAIEYDEDCRDNFLDNMKLNNISDNYKLLFQDVLEIDNYDYDFILANLNKQVILKLLPNIKKFQTNKPYIILSGLLLSDKSDIIDLINQLDFNIISESQLGEWFCIVID